MPTAASAARSAASGGGLIVVMNTFRFDAAPAFELGVDPIDGGRPLLHNFNVIEAGRVGAIGSAFDADLVAGSQGDAGNDAAR